MTTRAWIVICAAAAVAAGGVAIAMRESTPETPPTVGQTGAQPTLTPFENDRQLKALFARLHAKASERGRVGAPVDGDLAADAAADAAAPVLESAAPAAAAAPEQEASITNVQTAGVDEGGIVKRRGDHLVVLRRGRLFTLKIGDDSLRPVSMVDAYGPDIDPDGAWYDEMLVADDTIVVIGYSYARSGTEVGLFDLSPDGRIAYRGTWHLRSNDYYSSRNYASRLIGDKLVFYSPLFLDLGNDDVDEMLPGVRRWRKDQPDDARFTRILPADRIYRGPRELDVEAGVALHTVTICDLSQPNFVCTATAVLGAPGQTFYVAGDAAYVWTNPFVWDAPATKRVSDVFRIPLDGGAPRALQATGAPIDQLSFLERDGHLNVLVASEADGQWMWASERAAGTLALLRLPLTMFGDGSAVAQAAHYRTLDPRNLVADAWGFNNRFVGDWLVLGARQAWDAGRQRAPFPAYAIRYADGGGFVSIEVGHGVERIEAMGRDAILIGNRDADLHFSSLRLGARPEVADVYLQPNAAQGESRTHGFFHRPTGDDAGYVGLPTLGRDRRGEDTAAVIFLRNRGLSLSPAGALEARGATRPDDGCKASCVDWYGNARPIFIGERVFALLGYELVEGRYVNERILERRRVDFSPPTQAPIAR
jgi:hypothetical protein